MKNNLANSFAVVQNSSQWRAVRSSKHYRLTSNATSIAQFSVRCYQCNHHKNTCEWTNNESSLHKSLVGCWQLHAHAAHTDRKHLCIDLRQLRLSQSALLSQDFSCPIIIIIYCHPSLILPFYPPLCQWFRRLSAPTRCQRHQPASSVYIPRVLLTVWCVDWETVLPWQRTERNRDSNPRP